MQSLLSLSDQRGSSSGHSTTHTQYIERCVVECSDEEPLWSERLNNDCMSSPGKVCHREIPPYLVLETLCVAGDIVHVPDSLSWLCHVRVLHLWDHFGSHNLVSIR